MITEKNTLKELLENPLISQIAPDAIKKMDLTKEDYYEKTLEEIDATGMFKKKCLMRGFEYLFKNAEKGYYYFPIYEKEECADDPEKETVNLVWFPSEDPEADRRPYLFITPGGAYLNVWNMTEGWPVAALFNECGYHAFILTYRVGGTKVLDKPLDDFAKALSYIRDHEKEFHVSWDQYITCGFSAGGNLVGLWSTDNHGYLKYGMPKPQATFPVYPVVSWKLIEEQEGGDDFSMFALGMNIHDAAKSSYNIEEHVKAFPPCHLFLAAQDDLVHPDHSRLLKKALDEAKIPCEIEIGAVGGHGFADGSGMCMEGWPKRAIAWYESLTEIKSIADEIG